MIILALIALLWFSVNTLWFIVTLPVKVLALLHSPLGVAFSCAFYYWCAWLPGMWAINYIF